jgi:hypothetical protein
MKEAGTLSVENAKLKIENEMLRAEIQALKISIARQAAEPARAGASPRPAQVKNAGAEVRSFASIASQHCPQQVRPRGPITNVENTRSRTRFGPAELAAEEAGRLCIFYMKNMKCTNAAAIREHLKRSGMQHQLMRDIMFIRPGVAQVIAYRDSEEAVTKALKGLGGLKIEDFDPVSVEAYNDLVPDATTEDAKAFFTAIMDKCVERLEVTASKCPALQRTVNFARKVRDTGNVSYKPQPRPGVRPVDYIDFLQIKTGRSQATARAVQHTRIDGQQQEVDGIVTDVQGECSI